MHFISIYDKKLFKKMCFYFYREGDISLIESDAITNTTDETLTEKNTISNRIFQRAGPDLYDEILNDNRGKQCMTRKLTIWIIPNESAFKLKCNRYADYRNSLAFLFLSSNGSFVRLFVSFIFFFLVYSMGYRV